MTKITGKIVRKNITLSVAAQAISLCVSVIINLIVPKFITEQQYAYWQMYVLYVGYVGVLHFGLLDGLVLRNAQFDYNEVNKKMMVSQFHVLTSLVSFFAILLVLISGFSLESDYKFVAYMVAAGIITKNLVTYSSYSLQMTNRINKYVAQSIVQRVSFGVITILLLFCKCSSFVYFCLAEIIGDCVAIILGIIYSKDFFGGKTLPFFESLGETLKNFSSGFMLLIANWAAMFLTGSAKMVVQWRWDDIVFGKVSYAFSLTTLFLTFVNSVSIVLFPTIKRLNVDQLPKLYVKIRNSMSPALFLILVAYFPGCWLLEKWLPAYSQSLVYLGILLPMIIFASKVSLLTNNYLKAYRKEKTMLLINVCCVFIGFAFYCCCSYVFSDIGALLFSVVIAIMLRSVSSEIVVSRIIKQSVLKEIFIEFFVTISFIVCSQLITQWTGMLVYSASVVIYLLLCRGTNLVRG